MIDPALKTDRMQGIIIVDPKSQLSYHRKMIEKMNRLIGITTRKLSHKTEHHHYLTTDKAELQLLIDRFKTR